MPRPHLLILGLVTTLGALAGAAHAQDTGRQRNHCQAIGAAAPEALGEGRVLQTAQFSCRVEGGPMNGAIMTGEQRYELQGSKGRLVTGSGVVRMPGGLLIFANLDGELTLNVVDGKVAGSSGAGKGRFVAGYGSASAYAGKTYTYTSKATGPFTFVIDVTND